MSKYYLGDPCYVMPDSEWDEFCSIMNDDGTPFEYKGSTCVVIGTGGDGDFGGLAVDSGTIGCIPFSLCDPAKLVQARRDSRIEYSLADLETQNDFVIVNGEALNGVQCQCRRCHGEGEWYSLDELEDCVECGTEVSPNCMEFIDNLIYCSEACVPKPLCEDCGEPVDTKGESCEECSAVSV